MVLFLTDCDAGSRRVGFQLKVEGTGYAAAVDNGEYLGEEDIGTADLIHQGHDPEGLWDV